jgi:hypothetical protein
MSPPGQMKIEIALSKGRDSFSDTEHTQAMAMREFKMAVVSSQLLPNFANAEAVLVRAVGKDDARS